MLSKIKIYFAIIMFIIASIGIISMLASKLMQAQSKPTVSEKIPDSHDNNDAQTLLDLNKQMKLEHKLAQAKSDIEFFEPIRLQLIRDISDLKYDYDIADKTNGIDKCRQIRKELDKMEKQLYQVEKKLESAHFRLDESELNLSYVNQEHENGK